MAGRPREFDRDEALAKARDLFWARGYEGTSMAELVEELGLASARIYAAFGSKEALFREAVALYEAGAGGFADRAFEEERTARAALARLFRTAIDVYAPAGHPRGCMVVSAAVNCSRDNDGVGQWLTERRKTRTRSIVDRLRCAVKDGELDPKTDVAALGDYFATFLHGLSVQARDGVPRRRLLAAVETALRALPERRA